MEVSVVLVGAGPQKSRWWVGASWVECVPLAREVCFPMEGRTQGRGLGGEAGREPAAAVILSSGAPAEASWLPRYLQQVCLALTSSHGALESAGFLSTTSHVSETAESGAGSVDSRAPATWLESQPFFWGNLP